MSKTYTTSKGSVLPLMQLKSKDYMLIAHRIVWMADEVSNYTTEVDFPILNENEAMAKVRLSLYDKDGRMIKQVCDVKRESKKDFPDFTEKAVTGALGRCLLQSGFGTAFALQDLDEGHRIADAPLESNDIVAKKAETSEKKTELPGTEEAPKKSTFRKPVKKVEEPAADTGEWQ